jgi:hypothetical protein
MSEDWVSLKTAAESKVSWYLKINSEDEGCQYSWVADIVEQSVSWVRTADQSAMKSADSSEQQKRSAYGSAEGSADSSAEGQLSMSRSGVCPEAECGSHLYIRWSQYSRWGQSVRWTNESATASVLSWQKPESQQWKRLICISERTRKSWKPIPNKVNIVWIWMYSPTVTFKFNTINIELQHHFSVWEKWWVRICGWIRKLYSQASPPHHI